MRSYIFGDRVYTDILSRASPTPFSPFPPYIINFLPTLFFSHRKVSQLPSLVSQVPLLRLTAPIPRLPATCTVLAILPLR